MVTWSAGSQAHPRTRWALGAGVAAVALAIAAVQPAESSLAPVTADGQPVTPSAALRAALAQPELATYRPDPSRATALTVSGEHWVLVRGESGALCIDIGATTLSCATAAEVAAGELAITTIEAPPADEELRLAAARRAAAKAGHSSLIAEPAPRLGRAERRGIVPDGISTVEAVSADGTRIGAATVTNNAYRLDAGVEGQTTALRFVGASGTSTLPRR